MILRPYNKDFDEIRKWMSDERTHALWCGNLISYPVEKDNFEKIVNRSTETERDVPFVAIINNEIVGFFCYSFDMVAESVRIKFAVVDRNLRCKGYGREMLREAVNYAFAIMDVPTIELNVFSENEHAKRCYEAVGFNEKRTEKDVFSFGNESWDRCNMVITNMGRMAC